MKKKVTEEPFELRGKMRQLAEGIAKERGRGSGSPRGACYETPLNNSICAARQPSRVKRNRAKKLSSRHRARQPFRKYLGNVPN